MKIIVMIKQVPNTSKVQIDRTTGNIIRDGVDSIINPDDLCAIEASILLREKYGGHIIAISMGPPQAFDSLLEAIGMGVNEGILLSDKIFSGADTWATSNTLSKAIKKIGNYNLILCGRQAIDGDTAQVGPQVAASLGLPQITSVFEIHSLNTKNIIVKCDTDEGYNVIQSNLPALLSVSSSLNKPRYPNITSLLSTYTKKSCIKIWNASDIKAKASEVGIEGSFTQVIRTYIPDFERKNKILEGDSIPIVKELSNKIKQIIKN